MKTKDRKNREVSLARIDSDDLWLEMIIEPEELIAYDPLAITYEMIIQAEYPELMDFLVSKLPP